MKTFTQTVTIGDDVQVRLSSEVSDGEKLDTTVEIGGQHLCTISGDSIGDFIRDLKDLVENHRI